MPAGTDRCVGTGHADQKHKSPAEDRSRFQDTELTFDHLAELRPRQSLSGKLAVQRACLRSSGDRGSNRCETRQEGSRFFQ
jgi:hypothetical protein